MRKTLLALVTALLLSQVSLAVENPTLTWDSRTETFYVSFPQGGFQWACTRFKSLKETIIMDGREVPYEPASCGGLAGGERQTSYRDEFPVGPNGGEWEVVAILQTEDATEYPSNIVTVIH